MKNRKLTQEQQKRIAIANIENEANTVSECIKSCKANISKLNDDLSRENETLKKLVKELEELKRRSSALKVA